MFIIEVPYFNLDQIYNSKQCPRWLKSREGKYIVIHRDEFVKIEQKRDRLVFDCSEKEFYDIWYHYLDLGTDYSEVNRQVKRLHKKFKIPAVRGKGIHMIKQDEFEAYVYAKLIERLGWDKAKEKMFFIASTYGIKHRNSMAEAGKITWHEWPTPERLLECLEKEDVSTPIKKFLKKLSYAIVHEGFDITKQENPLFDLLSGQNLGCFPGHGLDETVQKNFKCSLEEFDSKYLKEFEYKGVFYMYLVHHVNNKPIERIVC